MSDIGNEMCLNNKICYFLSQVEQIWVIFTHLKLWVAEARHNFKRVKNLFT